jgi:hypothetical protein
MGYRLLVLVGAGLTPGFCSDSMYERCHLQVRPVFDLARRGARYWYRMSVFPLKYYLGDRDASCKLHKRSYCYRLVSFFANMQYRHLSKRKPSRYLRIAPALYNTSVSLVYNAKVRPDVPSYLYFSNPVTLTSALFCYLGLLHCYEQLPSYPGGCRATPIEPHTSLLAHHGPPKCRAVQGQY